MSDTAVTGPPPGPPNAPPATTGDKVRTVLRGIGQTLITLGLIVLLFVVYEVWITNIFSDRENHQLRNQLAQEWKNGDDPLLPQPGGDNPSLKAGAGIANIYMPRLGSDYQWTIVQGTNQDDLAKGPGHYKGTALPGQVGNFGVAGHRVGKGEPFLNLDKLRPDDAVIIETASYWFVYRVKGRENGFTKLDSDGVPGRQIVDPSDGDVLDPVPNHPGKAPTERLMTMTTCTPKFSATSRMVVYADLQTRVPHTGSTMPPQIKSLFGQVSV